MRCKIKLELYKIVVLLNTLTADSKKEDVDLSDDGGRSRFLFDLNCIKNLTPLEKRGSSLVMNH